MLNRAGFAMVAAATAFAFAPVTAQAQSCGTIELGAAVSATGIYAANGQNTKNGYEFALKKINDAGGVTIGGKCYHFKIKYYDDESTPARAAQLVERLIDQDKINYVLGPYGSPLTKAILPVIEKYKTPLVQGEAASRSLFTQGYKYQFGIVATSEKYLTPVVDMAAEIAKKAGKDPSKVKIAMIYQDDAFSLDVRQGVVDAMKKYKMTATVDDRMPKDLNDITSFLTKVKALKPDVLIVSGHEKGAATAARQMAELQIQVPLVGMTHCEVGEDHAGFPQGLGRLRLPDAMGRDHEGAATRCSARRRTTTRRSRRPMATRSCLIKPRRLRPRSMSGRMRSSGPIRSTRKSCARR